jgi:hypothetical protein
MPCRADLRLAVQRKVIGVLGDQHRAISASVGRPPSTIRAGAWACTTALARTAAIARTAGDEDTEGGWHHIDGVRLHPRRSGGARRRSTGRPECHQLPRHRRSARSVRDGLGANPGWPYVGAQRAVRRPDGAGRAFAGRCRRDHLPEQAQTDRVGCSDRRPKRWRCMCRNARVSLERSTSAWITWSTQPERARAQFAGSMRARSASPGSTARC